jgi:hypothetical protein
MLIRATGAHLRRDRHLRPRARRGRPPRLAAP